MHAQYYPMINRYDWGWWDIGTSVFWLLFLVLIFFIVIRIIKMHHFHELHHGEHNSPLDIAKRRYAKGEITKAEFDALKKDLQA